MGNCLCSDTTSTAVAPSEPTPTQHNNGTNDDDNDDAQQQPSRTHEVATRLQSILEEAGMSIELQKLETLLNLIHDQANHPAAVRWSEFQVARLGSSHRSIKHSADEFVAALFWPLLRGNPALKLQFVTIQEKLVAQLLPPPPQQQQQQQQQPASPLYTLLEDWLGVPLITDMSDKNAAQQPSLTQKAAIQLQSILKEAGMYIEVQNLETLLSDDDVKSAVAVTWTTLQAHLVAATNSKALSMHAATLVAAFLQPLLTNDADLEDHFPPVKRKLVAQLLPPPPQQQQQQPDSPFYTLLEEWLVVPHGARLTVSSDFVRPIIGRDDFFIELHEHIKDLLFDRNRSPRGDIRNTRAFVMDSGSTVGKTFSSLAFGPQFDAVAQRHQGALLADRTYDIVTADVGFDSCEEPTSREYTALHSSTTEHELQQTIGNVLFTRLLITIELLLVQNHEQQQRTQERQPQGQDQQQQPQQFSAPKLRIKYCTFPLRKQHTVPRTAAVLVDRLRELREVSMKTASRDKKTPPLVLLVVVDEGQSLDHWSTHIAAEDQSTPLKCGARLALRVLRQLQQEAFELSKGELLVLPLMTGLNPRVGQRSGRSDAACDGLNVVLGHRPTTSVMDRIEYGRMVRMLKLKNGESASDAIYDYMTQLFYPRVRPIVSTWTSLENVELMNRCWSELSSHTVDTLLNAQFNNEELDEDVIPPNVVRSCAIHHSNSSDGGNGFRRIYIDFTMWRQVLESIRDDAKANSHTLHFAPLGGQRYFELAVQYASSFKNIAFDFLEIFLILAASNRMPKSAKWLRDHLLWLPTYIRGDINVEAVLSTFTVSAATRVTVSGDFLSNNFVSSVKELLGFRHSRTIFTCNAALFAFCAEDSSPFDFVLLYRTAPLTHPRQLAVWLCRCRDEKKRKLECAASSSSSSSTASERRSGLLYYELDEKANGIVKLLQMVLPTVLAEAECEPAMQSLYSIVLDNWCVMMRSDADSDDAVPSEMQHHVITRENTKQLGFWSSLLFGGEMCAPFFGAPQQQQRG